MLKPQCNIFLDTETMIDITSRDGSVRNPWYKIFVGEVSFTDLVYKNDQTNNNM